MLESGRQDSATARPPGRSWLRAVLELHRESAAFAEPANRGAPPTFQERAGQAAATALSISRLHRERARRGFAALPVDRYLGWLAGVANVDMAPVLAWAGLTSGEFSEDESWLAGAARLGRALGIEFRQLLLHLRISLAERSQSGPVAPLFANRAPHDAGRPLIDEYEDAVREVEQRYGPQQRECRERMEGVVRAVYEP